MLNTTYLRCKVTTGFKCKNSKYHQQISLVVGPIILAVQKLYRSEHRLRVIDNLRQDMDVLLYGATPRGTMLTSLNSTGFRHACMSDLQELMI